MARGKHIAKQCKCFVVMWLTVLAGVLVKSFVFKGVWGSKKFLTPIRRARAADSHTISFQTISKIGGTPRAARQIPNPLALSVEPVTLSGQGREVIGICQQQIHEKRAARAVPETHRNSKRRVGLVSSRKFIRCQLIRVRQQHQRRTHSPHLPSKASNATSAQARDCPLAAGHRAKVRHCGLLRACIAAKDASQSHPS
jgi:hypothetical protein